MPRRLAVRLTRVANALVLEVQDSGAGIASADLERLFTPGMAGRDGVDLAGVGLAVAAAIVRDHGGRIHVDSTPGEGATFVVEIPIVSTARAAGAGFERTPDEPKAPRAASSTPLDVLVVDDEPSIRQAFAQLLQRLGHRAWLARDGEEALQMIDERPLDRILLDLRMPRLGGDALFAILRERRPALSERVIFLTGDVESEAASDFLRATGRVTLRKPFTLEAVREALELPTS